MFSDDQKLQLAHREISRSLEELAELFEPGMRVAFVAYHPGKPEVELMVGDGEPDEVIEVMRRMKARAERVGG